MMMNVQKHVTITKMTLNIPRLIQEELILGQLVHFLVQTVEEVGHLVLWIFMEVLWSLTKLVLKTLMPFAFIKYNPWFKLQCFYICCNTYPSFTDFYWLLWTIRCHFQHGISWSICWYRWSIQSQQGYNSCFGSSPICRLHQMWYLLEYFLFCKSYKFHDGTPWDYEELWKEKNETIWSPLAWNSGPCRPF